MSRSQHGSKRRSRSSKSRSHSIISGDNNFLDLSTEESTHETRISKIMGRYMVASKTLHPGEIILTEDPIVVGPCTGCKVQCLGCYKNLQEPPTNITRCSNCGWPLCSPTCPGLHQKHGHTNIECTILKETKSSVLLDYKDLEKLRVQLHTVVPLRCLLLKTTDPSVFDQLMNMESHNEIRKGIPEVWNGNQRNIVDILVKNWGLTEFTPQEIHTICGILEVNAFEIGQQGVNIRGVYPTAFLMSHDCIPNTNHTDEEGTFKLTVRASTRISKGQPITLSYAYTLQSTMKRREHLLENKFFECRCRRCSDPTELGTYSGALICPKCASLVLSQDPLDMDSPWSCRNSSKCPGYTISARSMKLLINRITDEIDVLDCNDIQGMEALLSKYRNVLHPTHYLCLGLKISLSQLYGKITDYLIHNLDESTLERKRDLCKEILRIFDVTEPGYTRIRGVTLYELHAPLMILLTRGFAKQNLSKNEIKAQLKEVVTCLAEASVILGFEPVTSSEGGMGKAAKEALLQIRDWEKIVGKI